jgi:hypothetical protein
MRPGSLPNVKPWRSAAMAMRWTAAAMQEAAKNFEAHRNKNSPHGVIARQADAAKYQFRQRPLRNVQQIGGRSPSSIAKGL